jgi:hypothetical protein
LTTSTRRQKLRALSEAHDSWVQRHLADVADVFEPRSGRSDYNLHNVDLDADGQAEDELAGELAEIFAGESVTDMTQQSHHDEYNSDVITAGQWVEKAHPRDEDGKFTDGGLGVGQKLLGKPLHINTAVIYKHKYADGAVVAEKPATGQSVRQRLTWDATKKKFVLQHDLAGDWKTVSEYGKGAAYQKFSKETGWLTPTSSEKAASPVSLKSLAATELLTPTIAAKPSSTTSTVGQPVKINTVVVYKTKYGHGAVVAYRQTAPGQLDRLVWSENLKKFVVQRKLGDGDWNNVHLYGKGETYSQLSKQDGWYAPEKGDTATGTPGFTGFVSAPSKLTTPAVTSTTGASTGSTPVKTVTPKVPTTQKFDAAQLQALHETPPTLDVDEIKGLYLNFKYLGGGAAVTLNSQSSKIFKALHKAVENHNKNSVTTKKLNLLQAVRLIDERSTYGGENKHLYEQKLVAWLQTPSGKTTATNTLLGDAAPKKPPAPKKPGTGVKHWSETGTPRTDVTNFDDIKHIDALMMQAEILKSEPWTDTQQKSLKAYSGKGYIKINESLRYGAGTSSHAKHIQDAMRPLPRSLKVYRSTVNKQFPGLDHSSSFAQLKEFEGKTITDKGFMSTSLESPQFGLVLLEIEVPEGTPAAYIASVSHYPSERELLLAAGLNYRVVSVTQNGSRAVVKLRVIP